MMEKRSSSSWGGTCKGVAVVEFALILPLLLILVFGILEFGFIVYNKAIVTNASREAARSGIVYRTDSVNGDYAPLNNSGIQTVVNNYVGSRLINFSADTVAVSVTPGEGTRVESYRGQPLTVRVNFTYDYLVLPGLAGLPETLNISAQTVMRME